MKIGKVSALIFMGSLAFPLSTLAGGYYCGNQRVSDHVDYCPDGNLPMFRAVDNPDVPYPRHNNRPIELSYFFRVWRTSIPGAVWTSPSGYDGYDILHIRAGVSVGDLIIKPDGTYIWNSYGGKTGRWFENNDPGTPEYSIVLIDTVENKQWKVGADPTHYLGRDIMLWDGGSFNYMGRM